MTSRLITTVPERQRRALRREARRLGVSMSEVVRRCLRAGLGAGTGLAGKDAWMSVVGLGSGDGHPVARRHHEALREALRGRSR